jgi:hypothetical protein
VSKRMDISRVDMRGFARLIDDYENGTGSPGERMLAFVQRYPSEAAKVRRQVLPVVPVNGSRSKGLAAGYFMTRLRDGSVGYFQRRLDDCLQAAIASHVQVAPHQVPDLHLDQLLLAGKDPEEIRHIGREKLRRWTEKHGVTIMLHSSPPTSARRWIGVVPAAGGEGSFDHCLIMSGRECLFNTSSLLPDSEYDAAGIEYGITIDDRR